MRRRTFMGVAVAGLAGSACSRPRKPRSGVLPRRAFGSTDEVVTTIGMGGARLHLVRSEDRVPLIRRAHDLGINVFEVGRRYWGGRAEEIVGEAIEPFRSDVFVSTQAFERTRDGALGELENSLRALRTDFVDHWQLHGIASSADVEKVLAPGGAIEALVAAKEAGKCRFIGFTGHTAPEINVEMLAAFDGFDALTMPLHVADTAYLSFERDALQEATLRGLGVFGIKAFANAGNLRDFSVEECLRYALSLPLDSVMLGFTTIGQLEDDVRIAQTFSPLTEEELDSLRARAAEGLGTTTGPQLEYWKRPPEPSGSGRAPA